MTDLDWTVQDEERDRDDTLRGNASWAAAEIIRQRRVIAELLTAAKALARLWEAQAIVGAAPSGDAWAEIGKEVEKAHRAIAKAEGGRS